MSHLAALGLCCPQEWLLGVEDIMIINIQNICILIFYICLYRKTVLTFVFLNKLVLLLIVLFLMNEWYTDWDSMNFNFLCIQKTSYYIWILFLVFVCTANIEWPSNILNVQYLNMKNPLQPWPIWLFWMLTLYRKSLPWLCQFFGVFFTFTNCILIYR